MNGNTWIVRHNCFDTLDISSQVWQCLHDASQKEIDTDTDLNLKKGSITKILILHIKRLGVKYRTVKILS